MLRTLLLLFVLLLSIEASSQSMIADSSCKVFKDTSGFSSFGKFEVGAKLKSIPQAGRKPNCIVYKNGGADCEFVDEQGVAYLVDGRIVVRKQITDTTAFKGKLPLGMQRNETLADLLRRSSNFPKNFPKLRVVQTAPDTQVVTGLCIRATTGADFGLELTFGSSGRLKSIVAGGEPN
ncbi:MAG: hypothetical protein ACK5UX_02945 [Burkholderiales bacterium]|jgi:hypothetical protein